MEDKKFCKFCGKQINKDSIVCPKCGRQLDVVKNEPKAEDESQKNTAAKAKFYEKPWFMWVMFFVFPPVGILLLWKFHPEYDKNKKTVLTVIFGILSILYIIAYASDTEEDTSNYVSNKEVEVTVINFSSMGKDAVNAWCAENKINCKIKEDYSDTIAKGNFISQSVGADLVIHEGDKISIVYSLGRKPTISEKNALKSAESYSNTLHMSKKGIYNQLISTVEGFTKEEAQYAIDNIEADWKENALETARTYQNSLSMSKKAIYNQLISSAEAFTKEEAQYAIDHLED